MSPDKRPVVVIAGGGPAGLTAAHELAVRSGMHIVLFEASGCLGGISRTVEHNGNRMDIGGHRFFSKSERVVRKWKSLMNMPARRRISRIYYNRKFFDYPVNLSLSTFRALGLASSLKAGCGYLCARFRKLPETSLENFYINRFGRPLYELFFEGYTEKVWGVHPSALAADWGAQRVKGLSLYKVLKDFLKRRTGIVRAKAEVETSLIEEFLYPDLGPGQLWEAMGREAVASGAEIRLDTEVVRVHVDGGRKVRAVTVRGRDGMETRVACDWFISSMPLSRLIASVEDIEVPADVRAVASGLPYRDFITVGLLVDCSEDTAGLSLPDTWIYVQDNAVRLGRIQVFNNWSPALVKDCRNTLWLGLEYFCDEGDEMWNMDDASFISMAVSEFAGLGIVGKFKVLDAVRVKAAKAYPAYFGTYGRIDVVRRFIDEVPNMFCVGRNGQHRYNNMDHSMLTAMEAADMIIEGRSDKSAIWNINTEKDYHEERS